MNSNYNIQNSIIDNDLSNISENTNKKSILKSTKESTQNAKNNQSEQEQPIDGLNEKIDPNIRLNNNPITPGKNTTFTAIIDDDATGSCVFKINGNTISDKITIESMYVRYVYEIPTTYENPTYTLTFVYSGDSKYNYKEINTTLILNISEKNLDPNLYLEDITIKYLSEKEIVLTLAENATGNVVFKINRTTVSPKIQVINSTATYILNANYTPGKYRFDVIYSGNYKYIAKNITVSLIVEKLDSTINTTNIISKAGSKTLFNSTLIDELGRPINNTEVVYKINSVTIGNTKTDENGNAVLYYVLPSEFNSKTYTVNVISKPTSKVNTATINSTLTLTQLKTKVVVPTIQSKINDTITLTATVIDENENNVHMGTILFKINGIAKKYMNITNGYALFSYKPTTNYEKNYTVEAIYVGYWKYADSYSNGTIEVGKIGTITTTRYVDSKSRTTTTISAKVEDKNQQKVNGGVVIFTIDGKYIGMSRVVDGAANYTFKLGRYSEGVYRLNGTYLGSHAYYSSNNLNYINITKLESSIVSQPSYVTVGQKVNISVNIVDETKHYAENGVIEFKINGTVIGTSKVKNGQASIIYTPPYNYSGLTLKYIATLQSNKYYKSVYSINNLTVSALKEVYVSPNGDDNNLGDKEHPFKTLKYAVGHVSLFGTVNMANGIYYESQIQLNSSVKIIGSGNTIIDGNNSGKTILSVIKNDAVLTIQKITLRNGKSTDTRTAGAIYSLGKLNITNVKFIANKATGTFSGGAIYSAGEMNITNSEFINNTIITTNAEGGALRLINNTTNIVNVNFTNNQAQGTNSTGAGAIYFQDGELTITSSIFNSNKAIGKSVVGGAIKAVYGDILILNTNFYKNTVNGTDYAIGGAINSLGAGLYINNSKIQSNKAYATTTAGAGALYTQYAALMSYNTDISYNTAEAKSVVGGAIEGYYAYSNYVNCTFKSNIATATSSTSFGGVIYQEQGNLTFSRCNFISNEAKSQNISIGGVLYVHANTTVYHTDFTTNKVTGKNIGGGAIANLGNITVTQSNFINNNATHAGDAITSLSGSQNSINENYWGSNIPEWKKLLNGVSTPDKFSTIKISH